MVSVPPSPLADNPTAVPLRPTRSIARRSYRCDPLPPGTVRLIDGTPAAAVVTLGTGTAVSRYLVAVTGRTPSDGLITRWQKPDGTLYALSYRDRGRCSCDCPACCWEATARADRRHRGTFGALGCGKLDALAALAAAKTLTAPCRAG